MQNLGQALREVLENTTTSPSEIVHICPHCEQIVPKLKLNVLGIEKIVQPRCKCEVEMFEKGITEAAERKRRNDIERRFDISVLGERFDNCTFSTFTARDGAEKAAKLAEEYASNFEDYGSDSLLLWGNPGNGKSHLAAAVCHAIKARGYIPVFQSVPELLERIRGTFRKQKGESEKEIMDALRDCDLLVLDDIGAEKVTDWVLEVMFRIIDGRYRKKKPTMFTTNFSPTELLHRFMPERPSAEDEITAKRIHDRILESSVIIQNQAKSYRMEIAEARAKNRQTNPKRMWCE